MLPAIEKKFRAHFHKNGRVRVLPIPWLLIPVLDMVRVGHAKSLEFPVRIHPDKNTVAGPDYILIGEVYCMRVKNNMVLFTKVDRITSDNP